MARYKTKKLQRARRHMRLRKKVAGTIERPRLCVTITANNMYVQFIDDDAGHTITALSTLDKGFKSQKLKTDVAGATMLGKMAAEKASEAGIKDVVFDRGGYKFHGRVKAIAESAKENGLKF